MKIEITDLTEDQVMDASELLEKKGFRYDEDYTTLYGARWKIEGMQFMGIGAAECAEAFLAIFPSFPLVNAEWRQEKEFGKGEGGG